VQLRVRAPDDVVDGRREELARVRGEHLRASVVLVVENVPGVPVGVSGRHVVRFTRAVGSWS
jgi:hypothetical protein